MDALEKRLCSFGAQISRARCEYGIFTRNDYCLSLLSENRYRRRRRRLRITRYTVVVIAGRRRVETVARESDDVNRRENTERQRPGVAWGRGR